MVLRFCNAVATFGSGRSLKIVALLTWQSREKGAVVGGVVAASCARAIELDRGTKAVHRGECKIVLTAKEFSLLEYLMANAGNVVSRDKLLSEIWRLNFDPGTKVVDVYIHYLRAKIDESGAKPLIQTVRGFGYMIQSED